ncbi:uncharacterized protein N7459_005370 [Penicillium hispanicum]|uniref:uncharacterized protein n=1 Tax=Penicillium hispanicum TaxID=1080232 RepID=UPI00254134FC|nr:uncharacterized protein N7459_005370 [Penicillium hispanicum]KAJ5585570.1 hypothetical protein N7459_005370 [Penicillium hispanicum]
MACSKRSADADDQVAIGIGSPPTLSGLLSLPTEVRLMIWKEVIDRPILLVATKCSLGSMGLDVEHTLGNRAFEGKHTCWCLERAIDDESIPRAEILSAIKKKLST